MKQITLLLLFNDLLLLLFEYISVKLSDSFRWDILLTPSGRVARSSPNLVHKAIFIKISVTSNLILSPINLQSTKACLIVLFNLPILIRVIIEEIFDLIMTQGPKLWVNLIFIKFESPLRRINQSSLSSESHICKVRLNWIGLNITILLLKDITNLPQINRVILVEVWIFFHVSQRNVHLPVSDHNTKYVVLYIFNLIGD